jgi:tetratricopeptide (TPR) repeat protein
MRGETRMRVALATIAMAALSAAALAAPTLAGAADPPKPADASSDYPELANQPPLIALSIELSRADSKPDFSAMDQLRAIRFEMARHPPPPDGECAGTLGAGRFADQYSELASTLLQVGDFDASIEANESALACTPRDASLQAFISSAYLSLGRIEAARAAIERGNAINPDSESVEDVRARVDFIQERWADATARFRLRTLQRETGNLLEYDACFLWLAQRRAGVQRPELPKPTADDKEKTKSWPAQILETLQGERTEAALAQVIRDTAPSQREWLTEALYYVGELRLAEGETQIARRHFAAVVNLRVLNFVEYGMARAELERMRERQGDYEGDHPSDDQRDQY